jgi:GH35 family endo-1,4-beta-xylanase/peptidoglycan/xylan/chitin deacetylase (PgdA/CDA1 family)
MKATITIAITFCATAALRAATLTPQEIQRFHDDLGIDLTPQQQAQIAQIVKPAAPWPAWRTNATARINAHRKTNLTINITDQNGNPLPNANIHIKQTRTPFHFGGILNLYYWKGNTHNYRKTIKTLFNTLGCQNALKPKLTKKHPLLPEFFAWGQTNNLPIRGHLLIWPDNGALPDYDPYKIQQALTALTDAQSQTNPPATQTTIDTLKTNLINITNFQIADWASKWPVYEWDVLNEILERHGIPDALNDYSQMAQWFKIADTNKILPNCKLMINEYQIISAKWWSPNSSWGFNKRAKYYSQQIDRIFNDGGHIDRIGFQSRFKFGYRTPEEYDYRITYFENKYPNLELVATEFEIMTYGAVTNEITRAKMTEEVITTYFSHPNVTGINAWTVKSSADNALCDTNGNLKLNGLIWYYLHRIRYATDTNLTTSANGQINLRPYKGNYQITTQYNTQTTNTTISLTTNQTITIKINTAPPAEITRIPTENGQKEIAIIFDGGPYTTSTTNHTSQLEILKHINTLGLHATFFLQGSRLTNDPTIINRIKGEGHHIGNYTQNATDLTSATNTNYIQSQLAPVQQIIKNATGTPPTYFRFPNYTHNNTVINTAAKNHIIACAATAETKNLSTNPVTRAQQLINSISPGNIIAMQPNPIDSATLDILIPALRNAGYRFAFPRLTTHPETSKICQPFRPWNPTTNTDLLNHPQRDTRGTGFTWKAFSSDKRNIKITSHGLGFSRGTRGSYAYTIFDSTGQNQPSIAIDLTKPNALLDIDSSNTKEYTDLRLMVFDTTNWFISSTPIKFSGKLDGRNQLQIANVSSWKLIDQSPELTAHLTDTTTLPTLTFSTTNQPNLQHTTGFGIYFARSMARSQAFLEINLYQDRLINSIDFTPENNKPLSRQIFGIDMTGKRESCIDPDILAGLAQWCEILRWPGGSAIEYIDLHSNQLQQTNTLAWIETARSCINTQINIIVGAPMSLGLDFTDPDPDYPNYGTMNPTNFSPKLAAWIPEWGGKLPRGVDYVTNLFHYLNVDASQGWGTNPPRSSPPNVQYCEVGNECDLYIKGRNARMGRSTPSTELIMQYYSPVFTEYATALHALSPQTKVMGPTTIASDEAPMLGWFLQSEASNLVDTITMHRYHNSTHNWYRDIRFMREMAWRYANDTPRRRKDQIGVGYTEWNSDEDSAESWQKGIFIARVLAELIANNVDIATCWHITMWHGRAFYKKNAAGKYAPLPSDYAMKFIRQHINFKEMPRPLPVVCDINDIDACAVSQNDTLIIFLINSSQTNTMNFTTTIRHTQLNENAAIDTMAKGWNGEWEIGTTNRQTATIMHNGKLSWTCKPQTITAITLNTTTNRPPTISNDTFKIIRNRTTQLNPLQNDADPDGDTISIKSISQPAHGTLTQHNNQLHYTPNNNYTGNETLTYTITDGTYTSTTATINITISKNHHPDTTPDQAATTKNHPITINVLTNDHDHDGDPLTIASISTPFHGTATTNTPTTITYTPNTNYIGSDTFTYTAQDNDNAQSPATIVKINTADTQLTFLPQADSYIYAIDTNRNMGTQTKLLIRNNAPNNRYTTRAYLRFNITGLHPTDKIVSITLKIKANIMEEKLIIYPVPNNTWDEQLITWDNAPPPATNTLGTAEGLSDSWINIPLNTNSISTNAPHSFMIAAQYDILCELYSRESSYPPKLTITIQRTADSDHDGIRDDWEIKHTGNLTTLTSTGDYDHDGITDQQEFTINTDPTTPTPQPKAKIKYTTHTGITIGLDATKTNRLYLYEYRPNLTTGQWQQLTQPTKGNGTNLSIIDNTHTQQRFYRIKIATP